MDYIYLLGGTTFLLGLFIAWLFFNNQNKKVSKQLTLLDKENEQLESKLRNNLDTISTLDSNIAQVRIDKENIALSNVGLETELRLLNQQLEQQKGISEELERIKDQASLMKNEQVRLEENLNAEKSKLKDQQELFSIQKEKLKEEFRNLANDIFEAKSSTFSNQSKKDIGDLLEPMKEKIEQFKKQVSDAYKDDERERFSLKNEIKNLLDLNQNLSEEARNLSLALKGDNKAQGDWGEMILESILENSGLSKGREYFIQQSFTNEDNLRFRPDVIIKYPGERCVVIDSKVSLKNYDSYVNASNIKDQAKYLKLHIESIKKHIQDLNNKNYQTLFKDCNSPDFVMMFMPIEPAYLLAVQNDPDLWNNAYRKHILLISPTNLIAALRMIAELWEHDKQNKNVMQIAEESGKLVDKFVGFLADFEKVGDHLRKSDDAFISAKKKIKDGNGNLISKIQLIKDLGAKAKKSLPENYIDTDDE